MHKPLQVEGHNSVDRNYTELLVTQLLLYKGGVILHQKFIESL